MKQLISLLALAACARSTTPSTPIPMQRGEREQKMANCPSAVPGAITDIAMTRDGVDVIVTATEARTRDEIVLLAERHVRMNDPSGLPEHSGLHGGPGSIGHCPIIHAATTVTATRTSAGVVIHVRALVPEKVQALQDETRSRAAALRAL